MHFSIASSEAIDFQWKELLDLLRPGFVDTNLGILFARCVHEIHFRIQEIDVADESAIEARAPLHRQINQRRGKEWHRNVARRFYDLDVVDLVGAAPKMQGHSGDVTAIFRHFGQLAVYIIAHPKWQQRADNNNKNEKVQRDIERQAVELALAFHFWQAALGNESPP